MASEGREHRAVASDPNKVLRDDHNKASKRRRSTSKAQTISEFSIRRPIWAYVHLQHLPATGARSQPLDVVTAHLHITASLSTFLGLHGSAIPFDILKLEDQDVWLRVPSEDRSALTAAASGWVSGNGQGWRVKGWSSWNAEGAGRDAGQDLFED